MKLVNDGLFYVHVKNIRLQFNKSNSVYYYVHLVCILGIFIAIKYHFKITKNTVHFNLKIWMSSYIIVYSSFS